MTNKLYSFKDHPEHKKELKEWADKWIKNALSTKAMDEEERNICREAVRGMYKASNLEPPPDHRIVFVPSPFVLRFAGGFAAAIWWNRKNATRDATDNATRDATYNATRDATDNATRNATIDATDDATIDATYNATYNATRDATDNATRDATDDATIDATYNATRDATRDATDNATRDATYNATRDATRDATDNATRDATRDATRNATRNATIDATDDATIDATRDATDDATIDATYNATDNATRDATYNATRDATDDATIDATYNAKNKILKAEKRSWFYLNINIMIDLSSLLNVGKFGLDCAVSAWNMWQGGNQWSAWDSLLTFFRYIANLPLDYSQYDAWEKLSIHSGPRIMHPDFCMISDRPEILLIDSRNRPHCENGPFCRWRDGTALYAIHGVYTPQFVVENPETITLEDIKQENNQELRRIMIARYKDGPLAYWRDMGAKMIHQDSFGKLWKLPVQEEYDIVEVQNGTLDAEGKIKHYYIPVSNTHKTAKSAVAETWGETADTFNPIIHS